MPDEEQKPMSKWGIVALFGTIALLLGASFYIQHLESIEMDKIGLALCHQKGLLYWYSGGETIHCYTLDQETGIKQGTDFWVDKELAKRIYLSPKPALKSDLGDLYTTSNTINIDRGCKKGAGLFNISGERVICYHCLNENESIGQGIPAGDWLCPR